MTNLSAIADDASELMNAISDVIENRPRPLRVFDQIHMKAGDMARQALAVGKFAEGESLAFIGDGDAIGVCTAYLKKKLGCAGPDRITVYDFDQRVVNSVKRFADRERLHMLDAKLYNCLEPFPDPGTFQCFYTNPPWGASNGGESVNVFVERGMHAVGFEGKGMVVIADDDDLDWPKQVLARVQIFAVSRGFYVSSMVPQLHRYHLDDAPDLRSCNLTIAPAPGMPRVPTDNVALDEKRLKNFYGRSKEPRVRFVLERQRIGYGLAHDDEYEFQMLEDKG